MNSIGRTSSLSDHCSPRCNSLLLLVVAACSGFGLNASVFGQAFFSDEMQSSTLIEPPREVDRLLRDAEKAIRLKAWSEATKALGIVLGIEADTDRLEGKGQDYFTLDEGNRTTERATIHKLARQMFDSIPDEGQATVELRYGSTAKQLFEQAISTGDWQVIDSIAGRYQMTEVGREAGFLAAERQLSMGNAAWAASRFENLLSSNQARRQFGPAIGIAAAAAWKISGQRERAIERLGETAKQFSISSFDNGNVQLDLKNLELAYNDLSFGNLTARSEKQVAPHVQGGGPDRNADSYAGLPLPFVSWHSLLHESIQHEEEAIRTVREQSKRNEGLSLIPSRGAIVVPPYLIAMTYDQRIHAVHLQTGQLKWATAFAGVPIHSMDRYSSGDGQGLKLPMQDYLAERIWGQQATGQLTADDDNIYAVVEQRSIDVAESLKRGVNANIAVPIPQQSYNVLQAYSIDREASLIWEVGDQTGLADARLANVLFLGPPLPYNGQLLVIGEVNGELILFAIDPTTGSWLWQQQLSANNASTIANDKLRRNFACCPSVQAGVVLCPTLSGELVAVDLASHSLLWATAYPQTLEARNSDRVNVWGMAQNTIFRPLEKRSSEISVLIDNGIAIHAPPDGKGVYAVDIFSGEILWSDPSLEALYLAGITNGEVYIVTASEVSAIVCKTGKQRWDINLTPYGQIVGRSARNGNQLLVPMTSQQVVQIDVREGTVVDTMRVEQTLGNLIATNDSLISLGAVSLTSYPIRDQVRLQLQNKLAGSEPTPLSIARKAEIALSESNWEQAFELAFQAHSMDKNNDDIKGLVRKIALNALKEDFQTFAPRLQQLKELMETGPDRGLYLVSLIRGLLERQRYDEGLMQIIDLTRLKTQARATVSRWDSLIEMNEHWTIEEDEWIATTLAVLMQKASPAARLAAVPKISEHLDSALSDIRYVSLCEQQYKWVPEAASFFLRRAVQQFRSNDLYDAEQSAVRARLLAEKLADQSMGQKTAKAATLLQTLIYRTVDRWHSASVTAASAGLTLSELEAITELDVLKVGELTRYPEFAVDSVVVKTVELAVNDIDVWSTDLPRVRTFNGAELEVLQQGAAAWPKGKVEVTTAETTDVDLGETVCRVQQRIGTALAGWEATLTSGSLMLIDPTHKNRLTIQLSDRPVNSAMLYMIDSIVIVERGSEVLAIDTLSAQAPSDDMLESVENLPSEAILWNEEFGRTTSRQLFGVRGRSKDQWDWGAEHHGQTNGFSTVIADHYGLIVANEKSIQCIDYRRGTPIWTVESSVFKTATVAANSPLNSQPWVSYRDGKVILFDAVGKRRVVLAAGDGSVLDSGELSIDGDIWAVAHGNCITGKKTSDRKFIFELRSGLNNEALLQATVANSSRAEIFKDESLVVWGTEQELKFWNLKTGESSDHPVLADTRMTHFRLEEFGDSLLILPYAPSMKSELVENEADDLLIVAGPMLAIDAVNGQPKWDAPLQVQGFYLPILQPRCSPAITLARQISFRFERTTVKTASLAIVDLRTGKLLYENNYLPSRQGVKFGAIVDLSSFQNKIAYRGSELTVQWTSDPIDKSDSPIVVGQTDAKQLSENLPKSLADQIERRRKLDEGDPF